MHREGSRAPSASSTSWSSWGDRGEGQSYYAEKTQEEKAERLAAIMDFEERQAQRAAKKRPKADRAADREAASAEDVSTSPRLQFHH